MDSIFENDYNTNNNCSRMDSIFMQPLTRQQELRFKYNKYFSDGGWHRIYFNGTKNPTKGIKNYIYCIYNSLGYKIIFDHNIGERKTNNCVYIAIAPGHRYTQAFEKLQDAKKALLKYHCSTL